MVVLDPGVLGQSVLQVVVVETKKEKGYVIPLNQHITVNIVKEIVHKHYGVMNFRVQLMEDLLNGTTGLSVRKVAEGVFIYVIDHVAIQHPNMEENFVTVIFRNTHIARHTSVLLMVVSHSGVRGLRALQPAVVEPQFGHDPVQTHLRYMEVKTALDIPSNL